MKLVSSPKKRRKYVFPKLTVLIKHLKSIPDEEFDYGQPSGESKACCAGGHAKKLLGVNHVSCTKALEALCSIPPDKGEIISYFWGLSLGPE